MPMEPKLEGITFAFVLVVILVLVFGTTLILDFAK
jgi:hypothetical protein